jgi:hypothetical protein
MTRCIGSKLLVFMDAYRLRRQVLVSESRHRNKFAQAMKELVDCYGSEAERIRVVLDNLNTHNAASLNEIFPRVEARRIMPRIEFRYTPTHAIWINRVEIAVGALTKQCLDRRIGDLASLRSAINAYVTARNEEGVRIKWLFDVDAARKKMARHYPAMASPPPTLP